MFETCNCDVFEIAEILFQQSVNFASRQLVRKRSQEVTISIFSVYFPFCLHCKSVMSNIQEHAKPDHGVYVHVNCKLTLTRVLKFIIVRLNERFIFT